jgi:hypothetical protein
MLHRPPTAVGREVGYVGMEPAAPHVLGAVTGIREDESVIAEEIGLYLFPMFI